MSFVDLKWQKSERNNFGFFDKFQYIYGKPFVAQKKIIKQTVCRTEKIIKQKMQGAESFVASPSAKRGKRKKN